jgi:hypothetical protein
VLNSDRPRRKEVAPLRKESMLWTDPSHWMLEGMSLPEPFQVHDMCNSEAINMDWGVFIILRRSVCSQLTIGAQDHNPYSTDDLSDAITMLCHRVRFGWQPGNRTSLTSTST